MSDLYKFAVLEGYPNGETWTHYFPTREQAEWAIEDMKEAHRAREYEIVGV